MKDSQFKEEVAYSKETGHFTWRTSGHARRVGGIAGTIDGSRNRITLQGRRVYADELAFFMVTGKYPADDESVSHINLITTDDSWENLKLIKKTIRRSHALRAKNNALIARNMELIIANNALVEENYQLRLLNVKLGGKLAK